MPATYTDLDGNIETFTGPTATRLAQQAYADHSFTGSINVTPEPITVEMTGDAGQNSPIARERIGRVNGIMDAAINAATDGKVSEWAHTDPVYQAGDRVNSIGVANLTAEGEALTATGPLSDNLRSTADVIDGEQRTAVPFNIRDLRMDLRDGSLLLRRKSEAGKPGLPLTAATLADLMSYYPATFGKISPALLGAYNEGGYSPAKTAETFNEYITKRWEDLEGAAVPANRRQRRGPTVRKGDLVMWVRKNQQGSWQAYTITSQRNTSRGFDGAAFLRTVADTLEGSGFYGQADYNPESTKVQFAGWMMPNTIVDLAAGDIFKAGISGGTSDAKNGGFGIWLSAIRNLCLNLIILAHEKARILKATHLATPANVQAAVRNGVRAVDGSLDVLRDEWNILRAMPIPDPSDLDLTDKEISKATKLFKGTSANVAVALDLARANLALTGVPRDALVEGLLTGWKAEPGETMADIHNAVSRLHFIRDMDAFQVAQQAGKLIPILANHS